MKLRLFGLLLVVGLLLAQVPAVNTGTAVYPSSGTIAITSQIPNVTGGTCTNQAVTAISNSAVPTCTTIIPAYTSGIAPLASPTFTGTVVQPIGAVPVWVKVTVANSSTNFAVTCAGPASFTAVCGTATVAKAGATTQSVVLATPGASFIVDNCFIKSGTAFTGTTTLTGTVGITGTLTGCVSVGYNLMAAVSATNFGIPTVVTSAASANGTDSIILALTSTVQNLSSISAGSVTVWLKLVLLP